MKLFSNPFVRKVASVAVIFAATFALYVNCWDNPFVLDDLTKIQQNPDLQVTSFNLSNFIFAYPEMTTQLHNDPSRPLVYIVYWLCWRYHADSPAAFHVVSTVVHGTIAALIVLITAELMLQIFGFYSLLAGLIAGLLFVTSPLIAGTVVYAYGLSDVLSCFFILMAYYILVRPSHSNRVRRIGRMVFVGLCFILALAAKQSSVVLAPLVIGTDLMTRRADRRLRIGEVYVPLVLIAVGYVIFRFAYFGAVGDLEGRGSTVKTFSYLLFQGAMILKYVKMTIFPSGFTIDHLYMPEDISIAMQLAAWAAIIAVSGLAIRAMFRADSTPMSRWLSFGWLFFLFCLLPTSSFLPTVDMFVERRAYISDIGLFILAGGAAVWMMRQSRTANVFTGALLAAALGAQVYVSLERSDVYASTEKLWQESLALDNLNLRARTNLAVHYSATKQFEKARIALEELMAYDPKNGGIYSKLGYVYMQPDYEHHDDAKAWTYMERSLQLLPDNIFALYNGGVLLLKHGSFAQSEKLLIHATELNPLMAAAWLRAGEAALFQDKRTEAVIRFRKALDLNANQEDAKMYLRKMGVAEK